jgi:hypothetical protein
VVTFGIPPPSGIEARSHEGHGWPTFFLEETLLGSLPEFWRLSDQAAVDTLYTHRSLLLFFKQASHAQGDTRFFEIKHSAVERA